MSRLEELIQIHCPDGVNYRKLGEICQIATGKLNVNKQSENGKYPFFTCAKEVYRINTFAFDTEALLISGNGNVGYIHYYKGKFNAYQRTYVLSDFSENIFFIKYVLEAGLKKRIEEGLMLGSVPYIKLETLSGFLVPILPPPVQEEIVRILDTFTALETELEAELAARTKQYEYYREILLNNTTHSSTTWKTLGEVSLLITKGTTPSSFETCGVSFVKTESFEGSTIIFNKLSYVSERVHNNELKRSILQEEDILFSIAGSIGKCVFVPKDILPANTNQALAIIRLKKDVNKKLIFYLLQSKRMTEYIIQNVKGSAQPNLNLQQMNNYPIPLPPLEVQEQIVSILDRFDTLVNDLKSGLPAEIALRRKQYEYYRDKLLTFKSLKPTD